uniref:Uncharacterized protein n=1 Tax=Tetranychus urticae TaxID=32264 RepID=T1L1H1_TETUR
MFRRLKLGFIFTSLDLGKALYLLLISLNDECPEYFPTVHTNFSMISSSSDDGK